MTKIVLILIVATAIVGVYAVSYRAEVAEARAYCEQVAAKLEEIKALQGEYPETVDDLLSKMAKPPAIIDTRRLYVLNKGEFQLSFMKTGGLFPAFHKYESRTGVWEIHD